MRKFLFLALLCPLFSMCQPITIKGTVITEEGTPIQGATVTLIRHHQSTANGQPTTINQTTTNQQGSFTIHNSLLTDSILVSAVGYTTVTEPINERGLVTVILKRNITELEDVVVNTGYQTVPRERATGSFATIDNATINQQVGSNIINRLDGVAPSVLFDKRFPTPRVSVRGLSTISGPTDPLIIVDNFPYEGNVSNINPADIESITILKDAAAASIWGARAGNGVIVITTKKGKFNQKLKVELSSTITHTAKPNLWYVKSMSASDYIDVEQFLFSKSFRFADTLSVTRPPFSPVYEILFSHKKGQLTSGQATAMIDSLRNRDVRDDFNRYVYGNALEQQYALNIRGGSANAVYYLSAGLDKELNNLAAPSQRITLNSNNLFRLSRSLQLSAGISYISSYSKNGRPSFENTRPGSPYTKLWPYAALAGVDGNALPLTREYRFPFIDTAGGGLLQDWKYYPLTDHLHNDVTNRLQSVVLNLDAEQQLWKGINLSLSYRYEKQAADLTLVYGPGSYFTRDMVNRFSQLNRAAGSVNYIVPNAGIRDANQNNMQAQNLRAGIKVNRGWGQHHIDAVGGAEVRQVQSDASSHRVYGYDDDLLLSSNLDHVNFYRTYITGFNATIPMPVNFEEQLYRFISLYANAAYTFKNTYTVSASARKDASNLFGLNANDKWNPLWSAGASWHISNENFYNLAALPQLKFRFTYGYSGNTHIDRSAVTTIRYGSVATYTNLPQANITQYNNPELRWERQAMMNFGLDFATKNHRMSGSIEYYRKKGTDLFGPSPMDITAGVGPSITKNVAAMKGQGIDLLLHSKIINKQLKWATTLMLSYNTDEITDYYNTNTTGSFFITEGITIKPIAGKPVYSLLSYRWGGLDPQTGDPQGYINHVLSKDYAALTGTQTKPSDLVYSGRALPEYFGALTNRLEWKGFTFSANLVYKFGYVFRKHSINYSSLFNQGNHHADYEKRWQAPGDEKFTNVPSMIYPALASRDNFYNSSEATVQKGDHIRIGFMNLGYDFSSLLQRFGSVQELKLFINAANLGIIWRANKEGIDPDYAVNTIPPSRSFSIGFRANF